MEGTVRKIMPGILKNKKDRDLIHHCPDRREWNSGGETKKLRHRVKKPGNGQLLDIISVESGYPPNLGQLDSEMTK